jgi:tetratricopeptide (TPR) repeat protein
MNAAEWAEKAYREKQYLHCVDMAHPEQKDPDVLYYAALSLEALNRKDEAISILRRAMFHNPKHEGILRSLAWNLTDDIEVLTILERLAHANSCESEDYCLMGEICNRCNRLNEAHHWYNLVLQKDPLNPMASMGLAEIHIKSAIRYLQIAEDSEDLELNNQMSEEWDAEEALRFIYDNIIQKRNYEGLPNLP